MGGERRRIEASLSYVQKYWEALNSEQWDPEDVNLERKKDGELLRVQVRRASLSPVDLASDD